MSCSACKRARANARQAAQNLASGEVKKAAVQAKDFAKNVGAGITQNYFRAKKKR